MFSTLLGSLPALDHPNASPSDVLGELAGAGLELLATGAEPPPADADPATVVGMWTAAAAATDRPVKQVLAGPYSAGRGGWRSQPTALAEQLGATIRALGDAGCPVVEIDEGGALAIGSVEAERRRFTEAHR